MLLLTKQSGITTHRLHLATCCASSGGDLRYPGGCAQVGYKFCIMVFSGYEHPQILVSVLPHKVTVDTEE